MEEFRRLTRLPADANFYAALRSTVFSDDYLGQIAALCKRELTLGEFGNLTHFFFADDILPTAETVVPKKRTLEETLILRRGTTHCA